MAMAIMQILKSLSSCLPFCDLDPDCIAIEKLWKNVSSCEDMEQGFLIEDLVIEILCRLPIETINDFKFVSKQCRKICLRPSFGYFHFQKSIRATSGIFIQGTDCGTTPGEYTDSMHLDYISLSNEGTRASLTTALDFLPEKVVVLASENGVILCRNIFQADGSSYNCKNRGRKGDQKEVRLYVCNPFLKEWRTLKPRGRYRNGCCYGFSYSPSFGRADFQVVIVEPPRELGKDPYQFTMYSSKTGMWKISSERCHLPDILYLHHSYFVDGVYYWLTTEHTILAFEIEQERSQVIYLPGHKMHHGGDLGECLGVSEGRLHYVSFDMVDVFVWGLEYENLRPNWVLKHFKPILKISHPVVDDWERFQRYWSDCHPKANHSMQPLALRGDILYLRLTRNWSISTYNIRTGEIEEEICSCSALDISFYNSPIVLPYTKSLLHVNGSD